MERKEQGISVTDDDKIIASPLTTVKTVDLLTFLDTFLKKENVELIVLGLPKKLNNTNNLILKDIKKFALKLK